MKSLSWKKLDIKPKSTNAPKFEEGLSLTYLPDKNKYIHFGGFTSSTPTEGKEPEKELGSPLLSAIGSTAKSTNFSLIGKPSAPSTGSSLLFSTQAKQNPNECQVVHIFDPVDNSWTVQKCKDKFPVKRVFHHSWYEAPNFFIYGGTSADKKILFDIYVLNTDTWSWKKFFSLDGPLARLHSAFISLGVKKYLIGGASYPENLVLNDVWSLSFEHVTWKTAFDLPGIVWEKLELKEGQMPNIKAHAAIKLTDSLMFIFGGYDQKGECTATSLLFDTEKLRVTHFETKGKKPGPRAFHKMILIKENTVCLFGGVSSHEGNFKNNTPWLLNEFYLLNISEGSWSAPNVGGSLPPARCFFAMTSNQNNQIIVLGGKLYEKTEEDALYILSESGPGMSQAPTVMTTTTTFATPATATITLERDDRAEKLAAEQKRQLEELESVLKNTKNLNSNLEQKKLELKRKIAQSRQSRSDEIKSLEIKKEEKLKRNNQNNSLNERLQILLACEKKKRKLSEVKTIALQDALKKSEGFIITVDSFLFQGLKEGLLEGMIKDDVLNRIEAQKMQHKDVLMKFKEEYEVTYEQEENYHADLKDKKKAIKQHMDLSGVYKASLSKDEEKYLSILKKH